MTVSGHPATEQFHLPFNWPGTVAQALEALQKRLRSELLVALGDPGR